MSRSTIFWRQFRILIPNISKVARIAFTLAPSSAAAERVFSILKRHMTTQQMSQQLTDLTQGGVMLDYNN